MKLLLYLLLTVVFPVTCTGLDREAFSFTNYDLEARVEQSQQRLAVRGKVTLRNDSSAPQRNVSLQISSTLAWRSIQSAGKPLQFVSQPYTSDVDHTGAVSEAIVTLPQQVPARGTIQLDLGYEGTIPPDATRLTRIGVPEADARHSDWDQIGESYTAVRGMGYVLWYPVATESANLSEGSTVFEAVGRWQRREQSSEMHVNLCVENSEAQTVFMNDSAGDVKASHNASGDSCQQHDFAPLGPRAPLFVIGKYQFLNRQRADIYYRPENKSAAEDYALAAELAEPFVRDWFGATSRKVRVVELNDPEAAPFESGTLLLAPLSIAGDSRLAQMTAVHQLSHAAFASTRLWMGEGLAHFAQAAYREQQSGRQAALDFMGLHRSAVAQAEKSVAEEHQAASAAEQSLINTSLQEFY